MIIDKELANATPLMTALRLAYRMDETQAVTDLVTALDLPSDALDRISARARDLVKEVRKSRVGQGGIDAFMHEFELSSKEGVVLMCLAEALLRVPDSETIDKLIRDKLSSADWKAHLGHSDSLFVNASTWALMLTGRVVKIKKEESNDFSGLFQRMVQKSGEPVIRKAVRQAMKILGRQFVMGRGIKEALNRAIDDEKKGYRYSYDMLGEGARTAKDAERYFASYASAIESIGRSAGDKTLPDRPGISVKLSALHPRYEAIKGDRVRDELLPRLRELVQMAKDRNLNFTIDAEEADRLEISLDVIAALLSDPVTEGWDGFGLAVQAYQKRAVHVIDWLVSAARKTNRKLMVRLVKGAYWDTEIKHAQENGADGYPVFSRKAATDLSYLCCAKRMLAARDVLYPQFATHNALTVAQIIELAGGNADGYEFQRLHGMGESLFKSVCERDGFPTRIYAPVGGHKDLLAYLVRRLLENGANSSFVTIVGDMSVPVEKLLERPSEILDNGHHAMNRSIPMPDDLYGVSRKNSDGLEFGWAAERNTLVSGMAKTTAPFTTATPLGKGLEVRGDINPVFAPMDGTTEAGSIQFADTTTAEKAIEVAKAGFEHWSRRPVEERAEILAKVGDLLEENRDRLMMILSIEAGKCLPDGIAEIREAVDFCRYYANEAQTQFGDGRLMPGPTGEENRYRHRGRGVFVCISPWNFPLAIFLGQISAALLAGNAVVAKPAEQTPLIAYETAKLLHEAGVPEDVFLLVPGDGAVGAALTAHPDVAGVAFTGSTETAWAINKTLAMKRGPIVPLIAETGGINAMLVDATALPEQVCDDVMMSAFRSAGQRCSALRLLYVQDDVADTLLAMLEGAAKELELGDPRLPSTDIGPVIDDEAKANIQAHIDEMRESQSLRFVGKTPTGKLANGSWIAPHIIELDKAEALTREVFGPVLHVVRYKAKDIDAVLDQIAASGYGLTLGVHSRIDATVKKVVDRLSVGNVYVNRNTIGAVVGTQPFGGSGLSGTGPKAGGPAYLTRFALEQVVSINTAAAGGNASLVAASDD